MEDSQSIQRIARVVGIPRPALLLALVLLSALGAVGWVLSTQNARARKPTLDTLVHDLRAELPWYYSLPGRKYLQPVLPRNWDSRVEQASLDIDQKRWAAANQLGALGTNAWPKLPELLKALEHKNLSVGFVAALTLAAIKAEEHPDWDRLQQALSGQTRAASIFRAVVLDTDWRYGRRYDFVYRRFGLIGLAATGPAAAAARAGVLAIVKSTDEVHELRALALTTLARTATEKKELVPLLQHVLLDTQEWTDVRAAAALALAGSAPEEPETRRLLSQALQDEHALLRLGAAQGLWSLAVPAAEVLPTLEGLLKHKLATVRSGALKALAEMGPAALPLKPEVQRLSSDENEAVRRAAAAALRRIAA